VQAAEADHPAKSGQELPTIAKEDASWIVGNSEIMHCWSIDEKSGLHSKCLKKAKQKRKLVITPLTATTGLHRLVFWVAGIVGLQLVY